MVPHVLDPFSVAVSPRNQDRLGHNLKTGNIMPEQPRGVKATLAVDLSACPPC